MLNVTPGLILMTQLFFVSASIYLSLFIGVYARTNVPSDILQLLLKGSSFITRMWWYVGLHLWDTAAARTFSDVSSVVSSSALDWAKRGEPFTVRSAGCISFISSADLISVFCLFFSLRPFNVTAFENQGCPLADAIHTIVLSCRLGSAPKKKKIPPYPACLVIHSNMVKGIIVSLRS